MILVQLANFGPIKDVDIVYKLYNASHVNFVAFVYYAIYVM